MQAAFLNRFRQKTYEPEVGNFEEPVIDPFYEAVEWEEELEKASQANLGQASRKDESDSRKM